MSGQSWFSHLKASFYKQTVIDIIHYNVFTWGSIVDVSHNQFCLAGVCYSSITVFHLPQPAALCILVLIEGVCHGIPVRPVSAVESSETSSTPLNGGSDDSRARVERLHACGMSAAFSFAGCLSRQVKCHRVFTQLSVLQWVFTPQLEARICQQWQGSYPCTFPDRISTVESIRRYCQGMELKKCYLTRLISAVQEHSGNTIKPPSIEQPIQNISSKKRLSLRRDLED